jgi:hypothetical protein
MMVTKFFRFLTVEQIHLSLSPGLEMRAHIFYIYYSNK